MTSYEELEQQHSELWKRYNRSHDPREQGELTSQMLRVKQQLGLTSPGYLLPWTERTLRRSRLPRSVMDRFWSFVDRSSGSMKCWIWEGQMRGDSGIFKAAYAHRYAYELRHGSVPLDLVVRHRCAVHQCVNPAHLITGWDWENVLDRIGREERGILPGMLWVYEDDLEWALARLEAQRQRALDEEDCWRLDDRLALVRHKARLTQRRSSKD
jgi:hypothetical protein